MGRLRLLGLLTKMGPECYARLGYKPAMLRYLRVIRLAVLVLGGCALWFWIVNVHGYGFAAFGGLFFGTWLSSLIWLFIFRLLAKDYAKITREFQQALERERAAAREQPAEHTVCRLPLPAARGRRGQ